MSRPNFRAIYESTQSKEKPMTAVECLKEFRLDYDIKPAPVFFKTPEGGYKVIHGRFSQANINSRSGEAVGIVSPRYFILQNRDCFKFMDDLVKSSKLRYTGAGHFQGGRLVWIQAKLPTDLLVGPKQGDDRVEQKLTLVTSHDGSFPLSLMYTPNRLVCMNQLVPSKRAITIKHSIRFQSHISEARKVLHLTLDFFKDFSASVQTMATRKLNTEQTTRYFNQVLQITKDSDATEQTLQKRETLFQLLEKSDGAQLPASRGTLWGAYNAVTFFADHTIARNQMGDQLVGREEQLNTLRSSWMGAPASLKARAYSEALELVKN